MFGYDLAIKKDKKISEDDHVLTKKKTDRMSKEDKVSITLNSKERNNRKLNTQGQYNTLKSSNNDHKVQHSIKF